MAIQRINDCTYSIGVLNPNLRVFDIIMKTEYGTSYNAYIIKGSTGAVLIETVHADYFDEYRENLDEAVEKLKLDKLDYVVMNHTEPDHSGSLRKLIEIYPDITVIASVAGINFLKAITNMPFKSRAVKDNESINLGDKTLKFINAPNLHWPDSMFTYVNEESILFSCDFLGAHYCEPWLFDKHIAYKDSYESAFKYYYNVIFSPFKDFVISGLDKIKDLRIETVCPSHGPVLMESIADRIEKYRLWSKKIEKSSKKAVIVYVSAYGCTGKIADVAERVLTESGLEAFKFDLVGCDSDEVISLISNADAVLFGSPTINRDALKPVWDIISGLDAISLKGKACCVFGSYGWSGEAVPMLCERLRSLKLNVFAEGLKVNFVPNEDEIAEAEKFFLEFSDKI